jgi:hypothetical protein
VRLRIRPLEQVAQRKLRLLGLFFSVSVHYQIILNICRKLFFKLLIISIIMIIVIIIMIYYVIMIIIILLLLLLLLLLL